MERELERSHTTKPELRVLHFAGIVNRGDFIDTVLSHLDRSRFSVRALVGQPPRRSGVYPPGQPYAFRVLGAEITRSNYGGLLLSLRQEIRGFRPHVLHAHHFGENLLATMATLGRPRPVYVLGRHYSDHVYYLTRGMKRWLLLALEAVCNRKAHQIVVPTEEVKTLLTQRQGVPAGKVSVIPYALEQQLYTPSSPTAAAALRALHGLEGRKLVVAACRLNPEKGLEHLLAAFQLVKGEVLGARLALLGTGPRDAVLRRLALDLGLKEEVLFLGWQDNVLDWLAAADVVVQPSECESYCQVLVEAMAVGTPVIMTPVGAAPEIIGADERGRLVPKRDAEALARALIELLSQPDKARVLGLAGQAFVRKSLNPANIRDKHQALYLSLLGLDRE